MDVATTKVPWLVLGHQDGAQPLLQTQRALLCCSCVQQCVLCLAVCCVITVGMLCHGCVQQQQQGCTHAICLCSQHAHTAAPPLMRCAAVELPVCVAAAVQCWLLLALLQRQVAGLCHAGCLQLSVLTSGFADPIDFLQWCSIHVRGHRGAHLSTLSMGEGSSRAGCILHSPLFTAVHAHGAHGRRLLLSVYLLPLFFSSISLASLTVVLSSSQHCFYLNEA